MTRTILLKAHPTTLLGAFELSLHRTEFFSEPGFVTHENLVEEFVAFWGNQCGDSPSTKWDEVRERGERVAKRILKAIGV